MITTTTVSTPSISRALAPSSVLPASELAGPAAGTWRDRVRPVDVRTANANHNSTAAPAPVSGLHAYAGSAATVMAAKQAAPPRGEPR